MNTNFHRRKPLPPSKSLAVQLLVIALRPFLVNAQYRMYTSYASRPSWYIGLIFLLLVALIIFGAILIIYARERCLRRRHTVGSPASTVVATSRRGSSGLDPDTVKAFPVLTYSEAKKASVSVSVGLDCAVCLNAFEEHETLRLMPKCGHAFHPDCVGSWLASHTTCPCCRADLLYLTDDEDSPSTSSTRAVKAERYQEVGISINDVVVDVALPRDSEPDVADNRGLGSTRVEHAI